jgi:hypothetical protein
VAKDCPHCGLVNPPEALRCDCGYDFPTGRMEESYLRPRDRNVVGKTALGVAATVLLIFLIRLALRLLIRAAD